MTRTFIAMECVEGENLRARMCKSPFSLDEALAGGVDPSWEVLGQAG